MLSEPRFPNAPRQIGRDWILAAAMATSTIIEVALRADSSNPVVAFLLMSVLIASVLRRRTNPLLGVLASFGAVILLNLIIVATGDSYVGPYNATWILILGYSLVRWGSGAEITAGLGVMILTLAVGTYVSYSGLGDAIGGATFLLLPAALGATVRALLTLRAQQVERIKLEERAEIARELHDTVAHHVSAIAISAQAGRLMAASNSVEEAAEALEVIEKEASETLLEMRSIVGLLRQHESDSMDVQPSISNLSQLSNPASDKSLLVEFELSGDLASISDPTSAVVFRLVQEAITNANRHALNASAVHVRVHGGSKVIQLKISDDGDIRGYKRHSPGYGLIGMKERVTLLGGSFLAGPGTHHGWMVQADLPRDIDPS